MKEKSPLNVASLVLGIISIVSSAFWYVTLPTGILAIIFGTKAIKNTGSKIRKSRFNNRNCRIIIICIFICNHYDYVNIIQYIVYNKSPLNTHSI